MFKKKQLSEEEVHQIVDERMEDYTSRLIEEYGPAETEPYFEFGEAARAFSNAVLIGTAIASGVLIVEVVFSKIRKAMEAAYPLEDEDENAEKI